MNSLEEWINHLGIYKYLGKLAQKRWYLTIEVLQFKTMKPSQGNKNRVRGRVLSAAISNEFQSKCIHWEHNRTTLQSHFLTWLERSRVSNDTCGIIVIGGKEISRDPLGHYGIGLSASSVNVEFVVVN